MPTIAQVLALLVPARAFTWWMPANPPTRIGWLCVVHVIADPYEGIIDAAINNLWATISAATRSC